MRIVCRECQKERDPHRPVFKRCDGVVEFVCRQCWHALDYGSCFHKVVSTDDKLALKKLHF